jgi:DNA-binding response OmpR family regulator
MVDDDPVILDMYLRSFKRAGYRVLAADTAEEALEVMRETPAGVLFLDLNLPLMNGIELCRRIRKDWPMSILFAVTGYASSYDMVDCRDAGFEDYFTKPVKLSELQKAAKQAFEKLERWKRP